MNSWEELRYSRQRIAEVGGSTVDQTRVARARVAAVGAGALGSNVVIAAASAGLSMDVYDFDTIGPETLGRSVAFLPDDVGLHKATALASRAAALNPSVAVRGFVEEARLSVGGAVWEDYDTLLLLTDNVRSRAELSGLALRLPRGPRIVIEAGLRGYDWHVQVMSDETHCYACGLSSAADLDLSQSCNGIQLDAAGAVMPSTLTAALSATGVVVQEALLAAGGRRPVFLGRSLRAAMSVGGVDVYRMQRRPSCTQHPRWLEDDVLRVESGPATTAREVVELAAERIGTSAAQVALTTPRSLVSEAECTRCGRVIEGRVYTDLLRASICTTCGRPTTALLGCECGASAPLALGPPFRRLECGGCGLLDPNQMLIHESTELPATDQTLVELGVPRREVLMAHAGGVILPVLLTEVTA